jgi:S-adenosylmethionine:diacylglycerol 3-amino-3-carboxypropyl transferase
MAFWRRHLDVRRFRAAMTLVFSKPFLSLFYARPLLASIPGGFGDVLRGRMERCFARHPNRGNPHARNLFLGETLDAPPPPEARDIELVEGDAATVLEREAPGCVDGFTLSNILDGAGPAYRERLLSAVKRAAAPAAVVVLRSFAEPAGTSTANLAAEDRSMLWGIVEARPVEAL